MTGTKYQNMLVVEHKMNVFCNFCDCPLKTHIWKVWQA